MKGLYRYISVNYSSTNLDRVLGGKASSGGDSRIYQPLRAITPRRNPGFCGKSPDTEFVLDLSRCKRIFAGMGGGGFSRASRLLLLPGARKVVSRPDGRFRTGRDVLLIAAVAAVVIVSER